MYMKQWSWLNMCIIWRCSQSSRCVFKSRCVLISSCHFLVGSKMSSIGPNWWKLSQFGHNLKRCMWNRFFYTISPIHRMPKTDTFTSYNTTSQHLTRRQCYAAPMLRARPYHSWSMRSMIIDTYTNFWPSLLPISCSNFSVVQIKLRRGNHD